MIETIIKIVISIILPPYDLYLSYITFFTYTQCFTGFYYLKLTGKIRFCEQKAVCLLLTDVKVIITVQYCRQELLQNMRGQVYSYYQR